MIYAIRERDSSFIKIGYTKGLAIERLAALQTGNPRELHLVWAIEGTQQDEYHLHGLWADFRVRGEWFVLQDAMLDAAHVARLVAERPRGQLPSEREVWGEPQVRAGALSKI